MQIKITGMEGLGRNNGKSPVAEEVAVTVEAILFASDKPLSASKISEIAQLDDTRQVHDAVDRLNELYNQTGRSFRIVKIAGGYQMQTLPAYNDVVSRLVGARREAKLSQAALETLAIIAYRQPVLRADIEAIRGVSCGEVLRGLMEKNLIRIVGRADEIGRPMLYGTTKHFLEVFGLADLKDLPQIEQLRMPQASASSASQGERAESATEESLESLEEHTEMTEQESSSAVVNDK